MKEPGHPAWQYVLFKFMTGRQHCEDLHQAGHTNTMDQKQWYCIWICMRPVSEVQIDAIHPADQAG